ncbi:MAG: VWA domain-containing protein, partial [Armatimonadia bacterium]|nr:VWA domain-containing protein [Armatimonadia bacterium]
MNLSAVGNWLSQIPVSFEEPWWLLGLLLVPAAFVVSARSVAGMAPWRRRLALAIRVVVLAALVLALSGMHVLKARDSLCILFLVDSSRSVGEAQRDLAMSHIESATENMRRGKDQMGIIVFGDEAHLETAPSVSPEVTQIETVLNPDQTDISQAIRLALASFPEESAKRIVLLSDGNETLGRAIDEARVAEANDVRIDVVKLHKPYEKEVAIEHLLVPPRVKIGEPFELKIVANSLTSGSGTFYVYRNKQLYGQKTVDVAPGTNVYRLRQFLDTAGFWTYDVRFVSEDDTLEENNRAMGFTHVAGAPRVLFCSSELESDMYVPEALADGYMTVEVAGPAGIPADMSDVVNYDAIIFSDIPATAMRTSQMELLRAACRDLGIGFMMIGGENSFGLGGYYDTPVEETLPVSMDITHKQHFPSTGLAIAVDTSGSMAAREGGKQKIEIANEAACLAAELLTERDQLTVISVDTMAAPVLPLRNVDNPEEIKRQIRTMKPGGGGIFVFTALREAYETMLSAESDSQIRHVILLADAADSNQQEGCLQLAASNLEQHGITTTVVALGRAHDTPFLESLAQAGGGRFYEAMKMEDVPRIYTRETMIVARSPIVEEPFYPAVDRSAPPLKGIDWGGAPPLLGYVGATEKPTSQLFMQSPKEDPI